MKQQFLLMSLLILYPVYTFTQEHQPESNNVLDDIVIQESFQAEFGEEKLPVQLAIDFSNVVTITERVDWCSVDKTKKYHTIQATDDIVLNLSVPQFATIRPAPVKIFRAKFKNIQRWQLAITGSDGAVFRTIAGVGTPPEEIAWDGLSDAGEPLVAGKNYAYNFSAVDQAGNRRTFPGQTFTVTAFYLHHDEGVLIALAGSALPANDGLHVKPDTERLAAEVASLIRYFLKDGNISITSSDPNADEFLELVANELIVDTDLFKRTPASQKQGNSLNMYIE